MNVLTRTGCSLPLYPSTIINVSLMYSHEAYVESGLDKIEVLRRMYSERWDGLRSRTKGSLVIARELSGDYPSDSRPFEWGG
jgi:hypothetical protein